MRGHCLHSFFFTSTSLLLHLCKYYHTNVSIILLPSFWICCQACLSLTVPYMRTYMSKVIRIYVCMSICVYMQLFMKNTSCLRLMLSVFLLPFISHFFPRGIYFTALNLTFSLALPHICSCVAHLVQNPHSSHHSHRFIHLFLGSFGNFRRSSPLVLLCLNSSLTPWSYGNMH